MQTAFKHNKTASSNEYSVNAMLSVHDIVQVRTFLRQQNTLDCSHASVDRFENGFRRSTYHIIHVHILSGNIVDYVFTRANRQYDMEDVTDEGEEPSYLLHDLVDVCPDPPESRSVCDTCR